MRFFLFALINIAAAAVPSVWDQLEKTSAGAHEGVVTRIDFEQQAFRFEIRTSEGEELKQLALCGDDVQHQGALPPAKLNQQFNAVRGSLARKEPVRFAVKGPWNACVSEIQSAETP